MADAASPSRLSREGHGQVLRAFPYSRPSGESQAVDEEDAAGSANVNGSVGRKAVRGAVAGTNFTVAPQRSNRQRLPRYKLVSRNIVENKYFLAFTMALTIYALVGDDFRQLCTEASADPVFNWMVILCIAVFSVELVLSVLGKSDYLWSFFFWLDLVSTASLLLDISIVADSLQAASSSDGDASSASEVRGGRAAKIGAKAGRVVRVLRLVRILKLYKAYYEARAREKRQRQAAAQKAPADDGDWDEEDLREKDEENGPQAHESNVGRKLSEMTTRRVICLILAMLLGLPLMQADAVDQAARSANYGAEHVMQKLQGLAAAAANVSAAARRDYESALLRFVYYHNWFAQVDSGRYCALGDCSDQYYAQVFWVGIVGTDAGVVEARAAIAAVRDTDVSSWEAQQQATDGIYNYGTFPARARELLKRSWTQRCDWDKWKARGLSLLSEEMGGVVSSPLSCPSELRAQERMRIAPRLTTLAQLNAWHVSFFFDLRPFVKMDAVYNLLNTITILILLVVASLMFSNDANRLIVHPVERMIKRVEAIRDNPLIAMKMADEEFRAEEVAKARKQRAKKERIKSLMTDIAAGQLCGTGQSAPMETVILEKTIIKLGSLLALGFGEAGANIIGHNMKGGDSAGVDAMIPGTRVDCIIGVVRIRDFSTATEVLQSKIMTFVNQIAEIVHGVAHEFHGAPNRNSGESFLVIWRVGQASNEWKPSAVRDKEASKLAGMSIVAFARILGGLHKSPLLATYRGHPGLQYRLGSGCRVNLSFGLHAGWAIEGAVGSEFKIDASYLSPNVSIATSIERATQAYGVSLIVAQSVIELCSPSLVSKCRLIDRVVITGSTIPMRLYCVDLDCQSVVVDRADPLQVVWNTRNRFKVRQFVESEKTAMHSDDRDLAKVFDDERSIREMRRRYTVEFFQLFNMGYQNYSQGEWQVARRMLSCTRAILGTEDGPSSALLRHMEAPHRFEAPKEWRGVRELALTAATVDGA